MKDEIVNKKNNELSFFKIFLFFFFGSMFGSFFEEIIIFFLKDEWTRSHDLIFGPFSTLYGFGIIIYLILFVKGNKKRSVLKTFLLTSLLGGLLEYFASLILDYVLGFIVWDYSGMFLNIHGRTTIPIMAFWGVMATILLKVIYPFVSKLLNKISLKFYPVYIILLVFMIFNIILSYSVIVRSSLRNKGYKPITVIGEIYDEIFDDDYIKKKFPLLKQET